MRERAHHVARGPDGLGGDGDGLAPPDAHVHVVQEAPCGGIPERRAGSARLAAASRLVSSGEKRLAGGAAAPFISSLASSADLRVMKATNPDMHPRACSSSDRGHITFTDAMGPNLTNSLRSTCSSSVLARLPR